MATATQSPTDAVPVSPTSRRILVAIWSVFLCWHIGFIYYLRWQDLIEWDTVAHAFETVSALYTPPFAAIGLFYWKGGWMKEAANGAGLKLAVASALIWNAILFTLTLMVLAGAARVDDAYELAAKIGTVFVWLVAGSMSYAFAEKK